MKLLLDTHILIWWLDSGGKLSKRQRKVIRSANPENPLYISEISLWEIATLVQLGRIRLRLPLRDWLEAATAPPLVRRIGVSPAIASELTVLPTSFHRDPADRILVATARVLGATLLTQDDRVIDSRLVPTIG